MVVMHNLLNRQIDRYLGGVDNIPENLKEFLAAVDDVYTKSDTDYRMLERALDLSMEELVKKNAELKRYAAELKESNYDLRDFVSIASHDLKEPLRKVMIFGSLLNDSGEVRGNQGKDYLARMIKATARMQSLIDDLLQFSQVSLRSRQVESLCLELLVSEVVADLETRINQTCGKVIVDARVDNAPVEIRADKVQMYHLFQNLISNALKFHKENESPVVTVRGRPLDSDWVEIRVEDNGIGFDEKYLSRIFKPFEQLHGKGRFEGSGMGLSICKKIVARHGGQISAISAPQKGATFTVTIPQNPLHDH